MHFLVRHSISKLAIYASLWSSTSPILYAATNAKNTDMAATPVAALQSVSGVELRITMALAAVAKSNVLTVVVTVDTEIMNIPSPRARHSVST